MSRTNEILVRKIRCVFTDSLPDVNTGNLFKFHANLQSNNVDDQILVVAAMILLTCSGNDDLGIAEDLLRGSFAAAAQYDSFTTKPIGAARTTSRTFQRLVSAMTPDQISLLDQWMNWMMEKAVIDDDIDSGTEIDRVLNWLSSFK